MNCLKNLFLSIIFLLSFDAQAMCADVYRSLKDPSQSILEHLKRKSEFKERAVRISTQKQKVQKTQRLTHKQKEEIKNSLLEAMISKNFKEIEKLSKVHDFLKERQTRFSIEQLKMVDSAKTRNEIISQNNALLKEVKTNPNQIELDLIFKEDKKHIEYNHQNFPKGISPIQWAVIQRNFKLLEKLLNLGFNYRVLRGKGAKPIEDNPLHLAIKMNEFGIARIILEKEGKINLQSKDNRPSGPRRFIDEKGIDNQTPFVLAVLKAHENKNSFNFARLISNYKPSHHVKSEYNDLVLTNYEWAVRLAYRNKSPWIKDMTIYFQGNNLYEQNTDPHLNDRIYIIKNSKHEDLKEYLEDRKDHRF